MLDEPFIEMPAISSDQHSIAVLPFGDFETAKVVIPEFRRYASYEAFLDEQEGRAVGLALAGFDACTVGIRLSAFFSWCEHLGAAPTLANLGIFGARVADYRRQRGHTFDIIFQTARAIPNACSMFPEKANLVYVSLLAFRDWLMCLGMQASNDTLRSYVELLLEFWCECEPELEFTETRQPYP